MKKIEKRLTIVSALLITIATVGFVIIPFFFENKISELKEKNNEIVDTQKSVYDILLTANNLNDKFHDIIDDIDIMAKLNLNKSTIKNKLSRVFAMRYESALFYLNAAIASKAINRDEYNSAKSKLNSFKTDQEFQSHYDKYFAISTEQTNIIDEQRKENQKSIYEWTDYKNMIWYISLAFQCMGMVIALIIIYIKKDV